MACPVTQCNVAILVCTTADTLHEFDEVSPQYRGCGVCARTCSEDIDRVANAESRWLYHVGQVGLTHGIAGEGRGGEEEEEEMEEALPHATLIHTSLPDTPPTHLFFWQTKRC